jgi:hypothetical protein
LDKELEKYYENQFDLFLHVGWKDFLEDAQRLKDSLPGISQIKGVEQLEYTKGQLDILDWLLGRKKMVDDAYEALQE